jgi:tripartite-type tricarboxylate transporter receptor subunit TctC
MEETSMNTLQQGGGMNSRRRHWLAIAPALWLAAAWTAPAQAADPVAAFPDHLIKIIVPYTPGGLVDVFARSMAEDMSKQLGQAVVIENRAGASQNIGAEAAARSAPDGYTLFVSSQTGMILNPLTTKDLRIDPARDFTPVATMFSTPFYLVVNSNLPVKSVQDLIALAKSKPGKLNYGSLGRGGTHHLAGETFKLRTGTNILHVPYKGSAPAMNDLLGGQIDMMFEGGASTLPYVQSGRLRALASTGAKRSEAMPDLPALNEILPGFDMTVWIGLVAPAGVPQPIVDKLNAAVQVAQKNPSTHEKFAPMGIEMMPGSPADFRALIKSDMPKWAKIANDAGVHPE